MKLKYEISELIDIELSTLLIEQLTAENARLRQELEKEILELLRSNGSIIGENEENDIANCVDEIIEYLFIAMSDGLNSSAEAPPETTNP